MLAVTVVGLALSGVVPPSLSPAVFGSLNALLGYRQNMGSVRYNTIPVALGFFVGAFFGAVDFNRRHDGPYDVRYAATTLTILVLGGSLAGFRLIHARRSRLL